MQSEGIPKVNMPLPTIKPLSKFTELVLSYYEVADEQMFKISTRRAWTIVNHMTGPDVTILEVKR